MLLQELNSLPRENAIKELEKCCGSSNWVERIVESVPFKNKEQLFSLADEIWKQCSRKDILEAFSHHPKIGDVENLRKKFSSTLQWASSEQSGVNSASEKTLQELAEGNNTYEKKFGYIFIVCATGKSAEEMLVILLQRLKNSSEEEIFIAAEEQRKITRIRLEKLLS